MQQFDKDFVDSLERKHVLSLDIAEHCGYYSLYCGGTEHFPTTERAPKKLGLDYQQHKAFGDWLEGLITENGFKVVVAEDVNVGTHFMALRKLSELRGVLFYVCAKLGVPIIFFNVADVKKWSTGSGTASKEMMISYCKKRWHIDPVDDNHSDAIHIFYYFIKRYQL